MFDPYQEWLGLPPGPRPPGAYQLLGLEPHEADPECIDAAAARQRTRLERYRKGPYRADWDRVVREIDFARQALHDPRRRAWYADRQQGAPVIAKPARRWLLPRWRRRLLPHRFSFKNGVPGSYAVVGILAGFVVGLLLLRPAAPRPAVAEVRPTLTPAPAPAPFPAAATEPVRLETARPAVRERLPEPDAPAQDGAEVRLRVDYRDGYTREDAQGRAALARQLLAEARGPQPDPARYFVQLREAWGLAARAGDVDTALAAIERQAAAFAVDGPALKTRALTAAVAANPRATEQADRVLPEAVRGGRLDLIQQILMAVGRGKEIPQGQATAWILHAQELTAEAGQVAAAERRYGDHPADPEVCTQLGRFYCRIRGDFDRGLPLLARGAAPDLAALARQDLAGPPTSAGQFLVAEGWYAWAQREPERTRGRLLERAQGWYRRALPGLHGEEQQRAERRLAEADHRP